MRHAAIKSLLGHKLRLLLSTLAVVLGVAFVAGSFVFTGMMRTSIEALTKGTIADVNVLPGGLLGGSTGQVTATLDEDDIAAMRRVDGVKGAEGVISNYSTYLLDDNGRILSTRGGPGIASNVITEPAYDNQAGIVLRSGRMPSSDDEVAVDPTTLTRSGHVLGDQVRIATQTGVITRTVVGTAIWGNGGTVGAMYTFFTTSDAQALFMPEGTGYQSAWISTDPGVDRQRVADEITPLLPTGFEAQTGDAISEQLSTVITAGLGFFNTFLLIFALIALVVAAFLIVNTFTVLVAQRSRELALYRALGATRGQVRNVVLTEALVTGFIGSGLGLGLGVLLAVGISWVLKQMGIDLSATPQLSLQTVGISFLLGTSVTVLAAWMPARQAGRVPPVAAMSGEFSTGRIGSRGREVLTLLLALAGLAAIGVGLGVADISRPVVWVGVGAFAVLLGVAGASPLLGRPIIWALGGLFRALFGEVGKLAELNASRQPRRTAATASALMIGMALVGTLSVLGSSTSYSVDRTVRDSLRGDFTISSLSFAGVPEAVGDQLAAVSGVADVRAAYSTFTTLATDDQVPDISALGPDAYVDISGYAPADFDRIAAQTLQSGRVMRADDEVMLASEWASSKGLGVGDEVTIRNPLTQGPIALTVTGIFSTPEGVSMGNLNMTDSAVRAFGVTSVQSFTVDAAAGADQALVQQGLQDALADYPMLQVQNREDYIEAQNASISQLFSLVYALLALAVVIAILGIVNTLALSVVERTREIGLLRAIGLTRAQLRGMISLESVIIALLGATLGVALGLLFGISLRRVLSGVGLTYLSIEWWQLGAFLAASVLVGILAAVWPARNASQLNILQAIATE